MKLLIVIACCVVVVLAETELEGEEPEWARQIKAISDECRSGLNATEPKINLRFHRGTRREYRDRKVEYITCVLKRLDLIGENGETNVENIRKHLNEVLLEDVKRKVDHVVEHYGHNRSTEEKTALHLWHSLRKYWKRYIRDQHDEGDDDDDDSHGEPNQRHLHKHRHH